MHSTSAGGTSYGVCTCTQDGEGRAYQISQQEAHGGREVTNGCGETSRPSATRSDLVRRLEVVLSHTAPLPQGVGWLNHRYPPHHLSENS